MKRWAEARMRSLDFVLGMEGSGSREPWKDLEQGKIWSELEPRTGGMRLEASK